MKETWIQDFIFKEQMIDYETLGEGNNIVKQQNENNNEDKWLKYGGQLRINGSNHQLLRERTFVISLEDRKTMVINGLSGDKIL